MVQVDTCEDGTNSNSPQRQQGSAYKYFTTGLKITVFFILEIKCASKRRSVLGKEISRPQTSVKIPPQRFDLTIWNQTISTTKHIDEPLFELNIRLLATPLF